MTQAQTTSSRQSGWTSGPGRRWSTTRRSRCRSGTRGASRGTDPSWPAATGGRWGSSSCSMSPTRWASTTSSSGLTRSTSSQRSQIFQEYWYVKRFLWRCSDSYTDTLKTWLLWSYQVGNKADLTDRREVEFETAEEFASQNSIPYIETSVIGKSNIKVRPCWLLNDNDKHR